MPIVDYVLKGFSMKAVSPVLTIDDLRSAGYIGLIKAIDNYDDTVNVPIKSWLIRKVYWAIIDELRAIGWVNLQTWRAATLLYNKLLDEHDEENFKEVCKELELTREKAKELLGYLRQDIIACDYLDSFPETESTEYKIEMGLLADNVLCLVPKEERDLLVKYYILGYTLKEVGAELGLTPQRALHLIKKVIKKICKQV